MLYLKTPGIDLIGIFLFFHSVKNIGNIRSLTERLFSWTSLLDQVNFLDRLSLKFGYLPVIIILNKFLICGNIYMYYSNK